MTRQVNTMKAREAWLCENSHLFSGTWYVASKRRRPPMQVEPSGWNGRVMRNGRKAKLGKSWVWGVK